MFCNRSRKSPTSASRDIGMTYSSMISLSDGGEGAELELFPPSSECFGLPSVPGQLREVPRRTTRQRKMTSATVGKGIDSMLNGSKLRLSCLHCGHVTRLRTCPIATSAIADWFLRRNLRHASRPTRGRAVCLTQSSSGASTYGFFTTLLLSSWRQSSISFSSSCESCWSAPAYWDRALASWFFSFDGARTPYLPLNITRSRSANSSRTLPPVPSGLSLLRWPLTLYCPLIK
mmetsp:Transcript_14473/g.31174  ORF Transcript_14473/g.31174 Transcript_14473/m.31174 type:complete len:232 (+) Transcript_14473:1076-1771(+)